MSNFNPLQKYFRQPKLFISLPSKGLYYEQGAIQGDVSKVPIFAMTGMDELIMKTPDSLFNGEATVKLIESCCPYIVDAHKVPSIDLDVLLVAIRMATYGKDMSIEHTCTNCGTENDFAIDLTSVMDHYADKQFDNRLTVDEEITINFKPLSYEEMTKVNLENFKLQKMLGQIADVDVDRRQQVMDDIYSKLADIQVNVFLTAIESVQIPNVLVTEKEHIREWLANTSREHYTLIKSKLEKNKDIWEMPKQKVVCGNCSTENAIEVVMDQSSFFV